MKPLYYYLHNSFITLFENEYITWFENTNNRTPKYYPLLNNQNEVKWVRNY